MRKINAKTTGTENFVSFPSFNTKPFLNCNICCLLPTYCLPGLYDAKLFTHISFHLYNVQPCKGAPTIVPFLNRIKSRQRDEGTW